MKHPFHGQKHHFAIVNEVDPWHILLLTTKLHYLQSDWMARKWLTDTLWYPRFPTMWVVIWLRYCSLNLNASNWPPWSWWNTILVIYTAFLLHILFVHVLASVGWPLQKKRATVHCTCTVLFEWRFPVLQSLGEIILPVDFLPKPMLLACMQSPPKRTLKAR